MVDERLDKHTGEAEAKAGALEKGGGGT